MKAIIQRVSSAQVDIEGKTVGKIGAGFLILLGVEQDDDERHAKALARRQRDIAAGRIPPDAPAQQSAPTPPVQARPQAQPESA